MPETLEEIKVDHEANFQEILKKCTIKAFPSDVYAYQYRMHCVDQAFRQFGFSPQEIIVNCTDADTAGELIGTAMASKNIRVEDWSHHEDDDRKGMYLYKDNELVFFIKLVTKCGTNFEVKTNVKFN